MAKSLFRQFPSDDLVVESGDWDVADDGQVLVVSRSGEAAQLIADDFWEAVVGPISITGSCSQAQQLQQAAAEGLLAFAGSAVGSQETQESIAAALLRFLATGEHAQPGQQGVAATLLHFLVTGGHKQPGQQGAVVALVENTSPPKPPIPILPRDLAPPRGIRSRQIRAIAMAKTLARTSHKLMKKRR